jgi:hypothetical protein
VAGYVIVLALTSLVCSYFMAETLRRTLHTEEMAPTH